MDSTSTKETENCILCRQDVDIFSVGKCDHPVCYRCSTKMRVLYEQRYCSVCREELDKVVFVKKLDAFSALPYQQFQHEKKPNIYFGNGQIYAQFRSLLLAECPHCPEPNVFSKFKELEQHMRRQHELLCCEVCTKHVKSFPNERKWYSRKDLARHRAQGDRDDTSHRGHPLCKFCRAFYLDNDELLKHLRRDHYFCHFCDADGLQGYYSDYQYLSKHFRENHYLCEEGHCATEQLTHAFRTEIEYKAHRVAVHSKTRAEAKQNRHLDLQFGVTPRLQRNNRGMVTGEDYEGVCQPRDGEGSQAQGGGQQDSSSYKPTPEPPTVRTMKDSDPLDKEDDFPALGDSVATPMFSLKPPRPMRSSISSLNKDDDFPALGGSAMPSLKSRTTAAQAVKGALKVHNFPRLAAASMVANPMTPVCLTQPRNTSSFHEVFPALISSMSTRSKNKASNSPPQMASVYPVPENLEQRNRKLIQSIKNHLHNDESRFKQFENFSGQFRQGLMSATQYHQICKDLLGEKFNCIFNEMLALSPDTDKQQELLTAHGNYKALEKQSGAEGGRQKDKKSAWQTASHVVKVVAKSGGKVCPANRQMLPTSPTTSRQVMSLQDFNSHKTLHTRNRDEFLSLQSISRIIRPGLMKNRNPLVEADDFPALGSSATTPMPGLKSGPTAAQAVKGALKADHRVSAASVVANPKTLASPVVKRAARLGGQVCPTRRPVLSLQDLNSHKTLHIRNNEEFPSLLSISRIIS